jgi:DNA topoisomerase-1
MKLRHALFNINTKYKKQKKFADDESDIDDDWIVTHEEELKAKEIEKAEKKFAKENEKLEEEGKKPQKDSMLAERVEAIEEEFERLKKERGTKKAALKRERPEEKIIEAIDKLTEKIKAFKLQIDDRDAGKEVALGTRFVEFCRLLIPIFFGTDVIRLTIVKSTT